MTEARGWSAEMDRKLEAMRKDPAGYVERAKFEARETETRRTNALLASAATKKKSGK